MWKCIYSSTWFFLQSIFADRYIHRTVLQEESIRRMSSVEFQIKKGNYGVSNFVIVSLTSVVFFSQFSKNWLKFW